MTEQDERERLAQIAANKKAVMDERARVYGKKTVEAENTRPLPPLICLDFPELCALPTSDYLVDGFLPEGALAELIGDSESLKSFFAIDLALSIASGRSDFFGQKIVKHGAVIYIAAEGAGAFKYRVKVWATKHASVDLRSVPFFTIPVPVNLRDAEFQAKFRELVARIGPVLIVVDTLHRCTPGADENGSRDIGEVVAFAQQLQYDFKTAVLFLHHPPKSDPKGRGRGSGALYYAADTEISAAVKGEANPDGTKVVDFVVRKQKDDQKVSFCLTNRIVNLENELGAKLCYASGRPIQSCVLVEASAADINQPTKARQRENKILKWIADNPGRFRSHVAEAVGGKEKDTNTAIDELLERGLLRSEQKGKGWLLFVIEDAEGGM